MYCILAILSVILQAGASSAQSQLCWTPGQNPFKGVPTATRLDRSSVRVEWTDAFDDNRNCANVDFLIKSHPRFQPSAYKLSDFTQKGQKSAVLQIDGDTDYVFQVIAREDKGAQYGIDYKYSKMVNSYATDFGTGPGVRPSQQQQQPRPAPRPVVSPPVQPVRPAVTPRPYKRPETRTLPSIYDDYGKTTVRSVGQQQGSQDISQCLPILGKQGGFGPGSKMRQDRLLINFVRYMNQKPYKIVDEFLQTKRSCKESHKKGFLVQSTCQRGQQVCCSNPWSSGCDDEGDDCFSDFSVCDGRCIPQDWMSDGWPDCMDGSDEADLKGVDGQSPSFQFQCVQCAGVVLPAAYLCDSSGRGLTEECVNDFIGEGECNVCVGEYLDL